MFPGASLECPAGSRGYPEALLYLEPEFVPRYRTLFPERFHRTAHFAPPPTWRTAKARRGRLPFLQTFFLQTYKNLLRRIF